MALGAWLTMPAKITKLMPFPMPRSVISSPIHIRVIEPAVFVHWSGGREEMERQELAEAEAVLQRLADQVVAETGTAPEFLIKRSENTKAAIRSVVADDPDIKILILAAAMGGRGPGPLVASIAKEGVNWGARKLPVTVVPGDLTDEEIADLA